MKKVLTSAVAIICLLLPGFLSLAFAHHLWVEKEGDKFIIGWGHPPKKDSYDPKKVKEVKAFDLKGKKVSLNIVDEKDRVYLVSNTDISMITVSFEGGYLVVTPEGKKRMTKPEAQKQGSQIVDSFYSLQFAKSIFKSSKIVTEPAGMKFEIVPLKDPLSIKEGENLAIKVLFEGKPLPGATIETGNHKEVAKTNEKGVANIKIEGKGMQVILAKYRVPSSDPNADFISYTTVLTWELK
jgi:nickel transport protein